jgi:hypothetical protein
MTEGEREREGGRERGGEGWRESKEIEREREGRERGEREREGVERGMEIREGERGELRERGKCEMDKERDV